MQTMKYFVALWLLLSHESIGLWDRKPDELVSNIDSDHIWYKVYVAGYHDTNKQDTYKCPKHASLSIF